LHRNNSIIGHECQSLFWFKLLVNDGIGLILG
jgi:hypothetical protein